MTDERLKRHILVKATVTDVSTDEGTFTAVISTASIDRDGDIVAPSAVVEALHAWAPNGKKVPLAWDHQYDTDFIIGHIEPMSAYVNGNEVVADGWIDQSTTRGKDAWRLVKSGTLGFSYGFLVPEGGATARSDGKGLLIKAMDIFEVTATPIPANADTRVLSYKNLAEMKEAMAEIEREEEARAIPDDVPEDPPLVIPEQPIVVKPPEPPRPTLEPNELRAVASATEREEEERTLPVVDPPPPPEPKVETPPEQPPTPPDPDELKHAASEIEREEQERQLPEVDPPPAPEPHTPPEDPKPVYDIDALKSALAQIERDEAERNLPTDVNPSPLPEPEPTPEPTPPPPVPPVSALRAKMMDIEREEAERKIPEVDPPPEPEPQPAPEPEPVPDPQKLREQADAIERDEVERRIPDVDPPPPPPEPEPVQEPKPELPTKELKHAAQAVERAERERKLPHVQVTPPEPILEKGIDAVVQEMMQRQLITDDELHRFARAAMAMYGTPLETLEEQVKRLERDERAAREEAVIKSVQVEEVQGQVAEAREAVIALEYFEPSEVDGVKSGMLKAVWTTAYINDLPDSAFLYIENGGSKDSDGKTAPRSLRHFPYKDANGNVDLPHLRNALARIPQSSLPQNVKDRLTARAQRLLDNAKSVDVTDQANGAIERGSRAVDPLRKHADDVELEFASDGLDQRKPPRQQVEQPKPKPAMSVDELRQKMFDTTLSTLLID